MVIHKQCILCGEIFETNRPQKKLCSKQHFKTCEVCGKQFEVTSYNMNNKTCSKECMRVKMSKTLSSKEVRARTIQTNLKRYGTKSPIECASIQNKVKNTNLSKYGHEFAIQNNDILEKRNQTNMNKFGGTSPFHDENIKQKYITTMQERYGVDNPSQISEIRSKIIDTNRSKYGVENPMQSRSIREKVYITNLKRYGVKHPAQNKDIQSKIAETCKTRYRSTCPFTSTQIKYKIDNTNLGKFGGHPMRCKTVLNKQRHTFESRWDGYTFQSPELMLKVHKTSIEKYGVPYPIQNNEIKERVKQTNLKRYGVLHTSQLPETHRKAAITRNRHVALDGTYVDSKYEEIVYNYCLQNNTEFEYQSIVIPYTYEDKMHKTIIDFKIDGRLYECKGGHLLKGCFDYAHVPIDVKLNLYEENNVTVITDDIGINHIRNILNNNTLELININNFKL